MMKVGVVGASGYTGEVLVQLLLKHPAVDCALFFLALPHDAAADYARALVAVAGLSCF